MVRTRFAPSPTGFLHLGSLRTAAYNYALAKHHQGQFILRIEDTDQKREVAGAKAQIEKILPTFGLAWDEEYVQSQRVPSGIYSQAAQKLVKSGHAYDDQGAIRLQIPRDEEVGYPDLVLGRKISWRTSTLPDAVLLKSDGFPTYHLAVVVDDHDLGITHVLRGQEWLPSTPLHLLLYKFLGYELPQIGHLTEILDPSGGKLSKRRGAASVEELLGAGYLPEAILNFVVLLGWAPKDNRELFTLKEFVAAFDLRGLQKSNSVFNQVKLDWFNGQYLRSLPDNRLLSLIKPYLPDITADIVPLVKERMTTLAQAKDLASFFFTRPAPQPGISHVHLELALRVLKDIPWTKEEIDSQLLSHVKSRAYHVGDFFMSLRLAICGRRVTPPLTESMLILGKAECLARLHAAHGQT